VFNEGGIGRMLAREQLTEHALVAAALNIDGAAA